MSTNAILGYKRSDGTYVCKHVHYGNYSDYQSDLYLKNYEEYRESTLKGASSEPFDGFYLDYKHCIEELHWTEDAFIENMADNLPCKFATLEALFDYASECCAECIYMIDEEDEIFFYEWTNDRGWISMFEEIDCIEPFNLDEIANYSVEQLKREFEEAIDFSDFTYDDDVAEYDVDSELEAYEVTADRIERLETIEDCINFASRFNAVLPAIKRILKDVQ